jgi:GxxExxY protein
MKKIIENLIWKDECYAIIGGCFAAYRGKGCGFLEPVYQECLEIEFEYLELPAVPHPQLELSYRGRILKTKYVPDFICYGKIVLEIKAVSALVDEHRAQVLNYLNATGFQLGLLVNFGHYPGLQYERIVHTPKSDPLNTPSTLKKKET